MKPLILILAADSGGPANTWIQANAPLFLRPGHDIVATETPTDEQIRGAYAIIIPESRSYFAIVGRATGKNIVFLDADVDSRDFIPGGTHVRKTLHLCDWMLGTALAIARAERAAAEAARAELAEKDAEIARLNERIDALAPVRVESTANGEGNLYHKIYTDATNSLPSESSAAPPLSPEAAAKVEFEAGREIALAGGTLPDLATDDAKAGFASVEAPADSSPPEPEGPVAPPEPAPDVPAERAPTPVTSTVESAGAKKTIRDIRRKPSLPAQ